MHQHLFPSWSVTPKAAIEIQEQLRAKVLRRGTVMTPHLVAGADIAFAKRSNAVYAAAVVLAFPSLEVIETVTIKDRLTFPYIPGLLSFREAPAILHAFSKLNTEPDLIFIDGHGISHPRAAGIACHMGVLLDCPVIGCAKSRLYGAHDQPGDRRASFAYMRDRDGRTIGAVVRTRDRVRPVYVSIGHKIDLDCAIELTVACTKGYRIPEPTRQADILAERAKRESELASMSLTRARVEAE